MNEEGSRHCERSEGLRHCERSEAGTSTMGGILTVLFANIFTAELGKTAILAAIGTIVSFVVAQLLKLTIRWIKKKRHR
jgi:hypothetical protein